MSYIQLDINQSVEQLVQLLQDGKIGVMPTDTVYGVVARALDKQAVERLYKLKSRERKPGTIIAASIEQLAQLGLDNNVLHQAVRLWPNPISVVIPCTKEYLHIGKGSVAVRIPYDPKLQALLLLTGPLVTSSANKPGEPTSNNINDAIEYFDNNVDFYVDGGAMQTQYASTVIRFDRDTITILREGSLTNFVRSL